LRNFYENRKLNFPTITIRKKKLRNPSEKALLKWIEKLA
jgi:mycoredoxin